MKSQLEAILISRGKNLNAIKLEYKSKIHAEIIV